MKAVVYEEFNGPLQLKEVDDPQVSPNGAIIKVMANGICRSDWHGWKRARPYDSPPSCSRS